jgi:hypothetical protein
LLQIAVYQPALKSLEMVGALGLEPRTR